MSNRKLASVGQKLPTKWENILCDQQKKIAASQFPQRITLSSGEMVWVPAIKDIHYVNFDHVPVWNEAVGNFSWGRKSSGRRNVKTGGQEKNCVTVVLTVSKSGKKGIPFIIFKGTIIFPCVFVQFTYIY